MFLIVKGQHSVVVFQFFDHKFVEKSVALLIPIELKVYQLEHCPINIFSSGWTTCQTEFDIIHNQRFPN